VLVDEDDAMFRRILQNRLRRQFRSLRFPISLNRPARPLGKVFVATAAAPNYGIFIAESRTIRR
jgi:hypothetical protein